MADPTGINVAGVTGWFAEHVPEAVAPFEFDLVAGGRSNLTFSVTDTNGRKWVLRRPPTSHVLASAHDMGREHRLIAALGPTDVPVPVAVGLCTDDSVNGAPFYVMEFVEGTIVRDAATAEKLFTVEQRRHIGEDIIDTIVAIHAVDLTEVGLDDLARHDGYIERQLKRWHTQFTASAAQNERTVPVIDEMHDFLKARIPEQGAAAIVHGDYRLDNCMIAADGSVAAVLDWELCTLGDPLADMGLLMVYWNEADESRTGLPTATGVEGMPSRADLKDRYAKATGRDVAELDFYVSFGYWKLACILEGVFARYAHGAMGNDGAAFEGFGQQVIFLGDQARAAAKDFEPMALFISDEHVELETPVFVLALDGWVDAGSGTALARAALLQQMDTQRIGHFDGDALIDYRARRPTMVLSDGVIQSLNWPTIEVRYGVDRAGNDVVVIHGPEPDTAWQAFCNEVVALAQGYDARMVVGLGSFPAPVPHTRPVRLASTAATRALAEQVGYVKGMMEVPCGIHAAIEAGCQDVGMPAVGIWARVPHYLAASAYPAAAAVLIDRLASTAGLTLQSTELHAEAAAAKIRIDGLVSESAEHRELVRQLEVAADNEEDSVGPSFTVTDPDTLQQGLNQIEEFLRDQNNT